MPKFYSHLNRATNSKTRPRAQAARTDNNRGQISVMIGIMMSTFLLFFAFVINTGMLVNAKINLQNAADLAAYAGAAVQARQLTQISYLNYEMRRQYKKFLFRIYVVGNMSQDTFPKNGSASGPMTYKPNFNSPVDYGVPTTCIVFNSQDNFCHIDKVPAISTVGDPSNPLSYLDSITTVLNNQLQAIEAIRQGNCKGIGITNKILNYLWLFNTDPTLKNLNTGNLDAAQKTSAGLIQGLAYGLGIVPRELILRYRIKSLESYINATAQTGLTPEAVSGLLAQADPSKSERTIQAFYSAYYSLGNWSYPAESITMDELLPSQLINLQDIGQQIDTYAIDLALGGNINATVTTTASPCIPSLVPVSIGGKLTVGVSKDPTILTYYAVRLTGTAKVLFSPFGDLTMKAYAAAQPFGSRIGPPQVKFGIPGAPKAQSGGSVISNGLGAAAPQIPDLDINDGSSGTPLDWNRQEVTSVMYQALTGAGNGLATANLSSSNFDQAYYVAMGPNPYEGTRYNIINDAAGGDLMTRNFAAEAVDQGSPGQTLQGSVGAFWAPVFTADAQASASSQITSDLNQILSGTNVQGSIGSSGGNTSNANLQQKIQSDFQTYLGTLASGSGENGEGSTIVKITNPFVKPTTGGGVPIAGSPSIFLGDNPALFRTSWNTSNDGLLQKAGRVGYSVKFVSFSSLSSSKSTTDGRTTWSNSFSKDDEADADLQSIQH